MIHLNGNLLCVIDCETTGLIPGYNEISQICVLPLGPDIRPSTKYTLFDMYLKPNKPENIDPDAVRRSRVSMENMANGMDQDAAANLFHDWFERLKLAPEKRIMPLGMNWLFDAQFIADWLGIEDFNIKFDGRYRDLMTATLYLNDHADAHNRPFPFQKNSLRYICNALNIPYVRGHDAVQDCVMTAECYRRIVNEGLF